MNKPERNKEPIPDPGTPDKQQPGKEEPTPVQPPPVQPPPDKPELDPIPEELPGREKPHKPADPQGQAFDKQSPIT